jgi:hypothetical protein
MPYIEKLGVNKVKEQIWQYEHVCTDPRIDGFVGWDCKQKLYEIKFAIDEALAKCPEYAGEAEWLEDLRTEKAFRKLGNR